METKLNLQIPFFPGFYESDLMNSDTEYWAIKEELQYLQDDWGEEHPEYKTLTEDDLDFRYEDYKDDVAEDFLDEWKYYAPEIVLSVEKPQIDSPRYYNYRNDELFADVVLREDWQEVMRTFMKENADWLKERIKDDWTSYDGFMSFMSNDFSEWDKHLFEELDERYISTMLAYMMYKRNKNIRDDLIMGVLEDIYAGSYVFITDKAKERIAEDIKEGRIIIPDPAQLELPFESE